MAVYHQSDLSAWQRCAAAYGYRRAGLPSSTNSAAVYGTVIHHAVEVFEREVATGATVEAALAIATDTFAHYWSPLYVEALCEPVPKDGWLPGHNFNRLMRDGVEALRRFADLVRFDDHELLATEYTFIVPIAGTWDDELGEEHWLAGAIDRLVARHFKARLILSIDDYKSGKDYVALRQNIQFTAYCYASTRPEFWHGARGEDGFGDRAEELFRRFDGKGRRATWINLKTIKFQDAGWRGPIDYGRFALAVSQMHACAQADIFPLSISGTTCKFCDYRNVCAGTGIADDEHGNPLALELTDRPVPAGKAVAR